MKPSAKKRNQLGKVSARLLYASRCLPPYFWQRLTRRNPRGRVHLILAVADHFEPSALPGRDAGYAPRDVQERRLETWCDEYPRNFDGFRDNEGRPFIHTCFYPAEQCDHGLLQRLADLCHRGWGEIELHLHHGMTEPATAESTRQQLLSFRDVLARDLGCLSYEEGSDAPKYVFVHGNFALANVVPGYACGVDNEMQLLAETGCYADMTYPTSAFHRAQISIINSLYECGLPLEKAAPHRSGQPLRAGRPISKLPFMVQGPWMMDLDRTARSRFGRVENGSLTDINPPSLRRLNLWKKAGITVEGRPDWIFIKLHTHGMDPTQTDTVLRAPMQRFLEQMIASAPDRGETLHFVSAREMANIILAVCDGREGNPGDYRDYRYKLLSAGERSKRSSSSMAVRG